MAAVRISYKSLLQAGDSSGSVDASLNQAIEDAFGNGPDALGVIVIEDLPEEFPALREELLKLAAKFASLPEDVREKYARPQMQYMFGWSHGKEVMNGKPDLLKGSYYANPLNSVSDVAELHQEWREKYPVYYGDNVWPETTEPGMERFEEAFRALGRFIFNVGALLARACESFVSPHVAATSDSTATIAELITSSRCHKARLLHYFPSAGSTAGVATDGSSQQVVVDDACGIHLDHSLLTGLCSAMYLQGDKVVPPPDAHAGLWIVPRRKGSEPVKVSIPANCLAFQTGEALQEMTAGKLAATPHFVRAGSNSSDVSRETFAFFLQPDVNRVVSPSGETFGQFSSRILSEHYEES